MAYYSKYTGAELEEKLDKVEEIPQLIAQMITGKDFVTKEDLLCVLKDYAPADYRTIPIDKNTIYWENGVLKAATSEGGQCQWELREHNGIQYLYSRLPVVTQYDVTMYADVNHLDLPSIYDGLPIDGDTIYWEMTEDGRVLKAKFNENTGVDASEVLAIVSSAGYTTQDWINNQNFVTKSFLNSELSKFVTLGNEYQEIEGVKNFLNGIQLGGISIYKYPKHENVLYIDGDVVVSGAITMFAEGDDVSSTSIAEGLPFDQRTIWFNPETQQIEVIVGTGGGGEGGVSNFWELNNIPSWITQAKPTYQYSEIKNTPDLSVYATTTLLNQTLTSYVTNSTLVNTLNDYTTLTYLANELKKYVTLEGNQDIKGVKNFKNGLQISDLLITKLQEDVIYIDANVVVRGGVTMFGTNEVDLPTIKDEIGIAGYNGATGLASFNSSQFSISPNGTVTIIGGSTGLDTAQLKDYLDSNKYTTETWVKEQGYASASSLSSLQTKVDNFLEGSDTDTIINKWKELETFLSGLSESDNLATILSTKWTTDNNLINKWNTAYGWGDHSKVGYALKGYVDDTFVTIKGNENVTGVHDFVNGLKIGNIKLSKSQDGVLYLEGNLVVKGGVTMYALDEVTVDSIIDSLPLASTSQYGIAKFNPSNFVINKDGFVTIIGGSGGLDTEELADYLTTNKYATQSWVTNQKYITGITSAMVVSALGFTPYNSASFTKANIKSTLGISDWALASSKPSYNFSELSSKPTTLGGYGITDAKISNGVITLGSATITPLTTHQTIYNLTLQAGTFSAKTFDPNGSALTVNIPTTTSHISEGNNLYFTNARAVSALTDTLKAYVTLSGTQTITGEKNFTGGLKVNNSPSIYYDEANKYWKLEGDLLVTGGVTMYGTDEGDLPSILDSLPIASNTALGIASFDSTYFSVDSNGMVSLTSAPSSGAPSLGELLNVDASIDATANVDMILFKPANSSVWTWKNVNDIVSGGGTSGATGDVLSARIGSYNANSIYDFYYTGVQGGGGLPSTVPYGSLLTLPYRKAFGNTIPDFAAQIFMPNGDDASPYLFFRTSLGTSWNEWKRVVSLNSKGIADTLIKVYNDGLIVESRSGNSYISYNGINSSVYYGDIGFHGDSGLASIWTEKTGWRPIIYGADYNGNLVISGGITMYSDQRKKTILSHVELSLKQIADAPLIEHYYNSDQDKTTHVGSIAQYWANLNDWFCKLDNEGYYTMEIQNCALASAISIARHLEKYESKTDKKIRMLKKRIQELEEEVERLKNN